MNSLTVLPLADKQNSITDLHRADHLNRHHADHLIVIFDQLFQKSENTRLVYGDDEPLYLPASLELNDLKLRTYAQILFAHGYFSSALHEIAHWCIAGKERRAIIDYGYWYEPDGRSPDQQHEFEKVEVKPQALEWIFSQSAGYRFNLSVDNLSGEDVDRKPFAVQVLKQVHSYLEFGLPPRAKQFQQALMAYYQTPSSAMQPEAFSLGTLL